MNRCLHITIQEGSAATPRRAAAYHPGQTGTDPGEDNSMPKLDDPTDPGEDNSMPKLDDPRGTRHASDGSDGSDGSGGCGDTATTVHSCGCGCHCGCGAPPQPQPGGTTTPHPFIAPRDFSGFVIVRMAPGIDPNAKSLWELAGPPKSPRLPGLKSVLEGPFKDEDAQEKPESKKNERYLVSRPLVEIPGRGLTRGEGISRIRELEKQTALTPFPPLHSLTAYWRLDLREHPGLVEEVVARLNRLAEVDLAYRELVAGDPQKEAAGKAFAEDQGYLDDAPLGIGAAWAWESLTEKAFNTPQAPEIPNVTDRSRKPKPSDPPKVTPSMVICDLEQGWVRSHNDLKDELVFDLLAGANRAEEEKESYPGHHGTAVLGQLAAAGQNPQSVKGAAAGLSRFFLASHYKSKTEKDTENPNDLHPFAGTTGHVAAAIVQAVNDKADRYLVEGNILLLEVQRGLLPTEVDAADFDAIRLASGLGITVIEAAGNGGFDLDAYHAPDTGRSLRREDSRFRDSGAVLAGAARASLPHDRAPFSNYGSRLDCYGWGEAVTTCGYGDLAGTIPEDLYTNSFSGTSSASPIIAGAAALLQALHKKYAKAELQPLAMRALLSDHATGTPQGPNVPGYIGFMPDLKAIVRERLQLVPVVYMRRSVCDEGSQPGPHDEISSSPDIFFWPGTLGDRYDEGHGRENLPAPGHTFTGGSNHLVYVRLRNRGLRAGGAHVHLFASPAATLITPERWIPWGSLDTPQVPQGDTLTVTAGPASSFELTSPPAAPSTPWSFLAVLFRPGEHDHPGATSSSQPPPFFDWRTGLPPAAPYFDWAQYRAFLRRRGVSWRNTHRVNAAMADPVLPFFIAGTPDNARHFDFEVIQRLPEGTAVTLQVPPALAAKLHQRQPWLEVSAGDITLPHRPRTRFSRVQLPAGTYAEATFAVVPGAGYPLGPGHSLAIRQLWHGEEVGRITWYFTPDL